MLRDLPHSARRRPTTTSGHVTVAVVVTAAFGVLGPLLPSAVATYRFTGGTGPAWLDSVPSLALVLDAVVVAVVGPWAFYRAGRALRPSIGTSWAHTVRRVLAAAGMAYGAVSLTLLGTAVIGTPTIGLLLGLPMTSHVLLLTAFGPLAVVVGLALLLATGIDACATSRRGTASSGGLAYP